MINIFTILTAAINLLITYTMVTTLWRQGVLQHFLHGHKKMVRARAVVVKVLPELPA